MAKSPWDKVLSFLSSLLNSIDNEASPSETTPYWIDDQPEKIYLTDRHPDVIAVKLISWEFAQLINNRDYESLDGRVEYHLYTDTYLERLINEKDEKNTLKFLKNNKLKSYCEDYKIVSMCFNKTVNEVEVIYSVRIIVTDATDKYFKSLNRGRTGTALEKNKPYDQLYKLNLIKQKETWKISGFEADSEITVPDT